MSGRFTLYILLGMVLGILVGYLCNTNLEPTTAKDVAGYFAILTDIFLRLIKMIIAPLVFSTLVVGIVHVGDTASLSRIGFLTIAWFLGASLVSLFMGIVMVEWLEPGVGLGLPLPDASATVAVKAGALTLKDFITHVFPKSFFEAMATNEILQIVVFSLFVGVALASLGEAGKKLTEILDQVVMVMLLITGYVMKFAPIAVFAAIAATITTQGLGILATYLKFVGGFYVSLGLLWGVLLLAGSAVIGRQIIALTKGIREPLLLAFSTASSEAAYPKTLEQLEKLGVPKDRKSVV
jgi:Na+/H+-dicarboxylate symporter